MKKTNKWLSIALVLLTAAVIMSVGGGCANVYSGKPSDDAAPATPADEQAAIDVMVRYLDAFCAKDAQAMSDTMCSPVRLKYLNEANGATEEDFLRMMEDAIYNLDIEYGSDSVLEYDPESLKSENGDQYIDILNLEFKVDRENGSIVDMARIIKATVWMNTGTGKKVDVADGSMLVYRHDGEWYIYGSAG